MLSALLTISAAYMITWLLQVIGWPYLVWALGSRLRDRGWSLARLLTWLAVSLIIWSLAYFKLPLNTVWAIWLVLFILAVGAVSLTLRCRSQIKQVFQEAKWLLLVAESLFLFGFFFLSLVRGFNPAILDLEKFMDAGFMASYLRAPTLPAPDMWLAGETINYYTFGHFMGSVMTRIWLLPISLSYNLLLGLIMALSLSLSFSVVVNFLSPLFPSRLKPLILGGLVGTLLVNLGGNSHTFWYLFKHHGWTGYWYADATRFIDRTIHEFPAYSYVVADLHAHVWGLPLVLTYFIFLMLWSRALFLPQRKAGLGLAATLGLFLGIFAMTSTWDALIYTLLTGLVSFVLLLAYPPLIKPLLFSAMVALPTATLTALPWFLSFTSIAEGIAVATQHSPLWQLAALWTGHFLLSLLALITAFIALIKHRHRLSPTAIATYLLIVALVVTAWLLLILPELIFFKDIYSGHPRANTMFKLTYQAFIMMSLTGGWLFGTLFLKRLAPHWLRLIAGLGLILVTGAVLCFPFFAYRDYYNRLKGFKGLDGHQWLEAQYPDDYQAILWLNSQVRGQPVILESWGESYTTFDRVSSITGLPTVLGWRVHEWLWRGGFDIPGARTTEVDTIFSNPTTVTSQELLQRYQVQYIFIGAKEREQYPNLNQAAFKSLGDVVFESGSTFIVKL